MTIKSCGALTAFSCVKKIIIPKYFLAKCLDEIKTSKGERIVRKTLF